MSCQECLIYSWCKGCGTEMLLEARAGADGPEAASGVVQTPPCAPLVWWSIKPAGTVHDEGDRLKAWAGGVGGLKGRGSAFGGVTGATRGRGPEAGPCCEVGLVCAMKLRMTGQSCQSWPLTEDKKPTKILQPACLEPAARMCAGESRCRLGSSCICAEDVRVLLLCTCKGHPQWEQALTLCSSCCLQAGHIRQGSVRAGMTDRNSSAMENYVTKHLSLTP